jgi:hypothetical protein
MGDRALVQFKDKSGELSPVCYLHSHGYAVMDLIQELEEIMQGRPDDLNYSFARFVGVCHTSISGNLSLGVWNQLTELNDGDSHGDAGVLVVHCFGEWEVECWGGYYKSYKLYARLCDVTGEGFNQGYCFGDGESYMKYEKHVIKHLRESQSDDEKGLTDAELLAKAVEVDDIVYWSDWSECNENFELEDYDDVRE